MVLLALWFVVGFSYYGFEFGFSMLSEDRTVGVFYQGEFGNISFIIVNVSYTFSVHEYPD